MTIVIVILILVVIAGYLVWLRSRYQPTVSARPEVITEQASPSPEVTSSPSPTVSATPSATPKVTPKSATSGATTR